MKSFVALYIGSADTDPAQSMPDPETMARGMAAWSGWMQANAARIVDSGGPLGKTKQVGKGGVSDSRNAIAAYVIVTAESHEEAAQLFLDHPHFSIFPGDRIEIMERLPIPGR